MKETIGIDASLINTNFRDCENPNRKVGDASVQLTVRC